ncbi:hypothetical protein HDV01_000075 [Terramyces sp. JEL0728]|nr:hypothetical protein HDV01_000075 [Terramyces sp. JEL0728]
MNSLQQFLQLVKISIQTQNGNQLQQLVRWGSIDDVIPNNLRQHLMLNYEQMEANCQSHIDRDFLPFITNYLIFAGKQDFDSYLQVFSAFVGNRLCIIPWAVPLMKSLIRGLVFWSVKADLMGLTADNRVKSQSELAKLRAVLLKDTDEMKANLLAVANASLKLYFGMKEMHQALKVVEQTGNYLPDTIVIQKADTVTFNYYVGRVYIYFHQFDKADQVLSKAMEDCTFSHFHNRQSILKYLVIARIVRGKLPTPQLLQKYQLDKHYLPLLNAIIKGDIGRYNEELDLQRKYFTKSGFYMILKHRVLPLLYRNLIQRVFAGLQLISSNPTTNIPVELFYKVINNCKIECFTIHDVESLIVSLIDQGFIKGYLSPDRKIIVFRKSGDTFPSPYSTGGPVYCLAYNYRRQQIMAGQNKKVRLFQLIGEDSHTTTDVLERKSVSCSEHHDIVSCIVSCEGRFYSAGYDRKIIIYDVPHHGDLKLRVANSIKDAHDASISCMIFGKDADNSWLITGSIDRVVKLWSLDGNLMQRVDGFNDTITSICYVIPTQTLWVTANSPTPIVYDPRSGINVSDFVQTDDERFHVRGGAIGFRNMIFVPETNEVIAISNRRSIVVWRYNSVAPLTVLPGHSDIVECLTYNPKEPILIFSGGDDGIIRKWERLQLITFMYSQESFTLPKEEFKDNEESKLKEAEEGTKKSKILKHPTLKYLRKKKSGGKSHINDLPVLPPITKQKAVRPSVVSMAYYEELDYLISGYEDSKIRIWGYNEETILYNQEPKTTTDKDLVDTKNVPDEAVTSRVAGMTLKETLNEHKDSVTALVCFKRDNNHWLLSTGWDRRIVLWNMSTLKMHDVFRNHSAIQTKEELAADGIILGMDYSCERNEFAYCSADKLAYLRRFSSNGGEMKLLARHEAEVTQIKWNKHASQWITGSEDRTIRIWPAEGIPCIRVINNDGPVTALCIDAINGCLVSGSQDKIIRVFDLDKKDEIVQKNNGHTDEIRSIIHIPARNQYVSASWDNSVRIWNAYLKKGQRKIAKSTMKFQAEEEEQTMSYSELNPLIVPKLLSKPLFVKEFVLEKPPVKEEDFEENIEKSTLEEELRQTLNDLDVALNSTEKQNKGGKRAFKLNKKKVG